MVIPKNYPAKILLFGEYSILFDGKGLVLPFPKYSGSWNEIDDNKNRFPSSEELLSFIKSLNNQKSQIVAKFQKFQIEKFAQDLKKGLFFDSNIPQGMGLGSSGALCAAIWDRYLPVEDHAFMKDNLSENRSCLALIEAFYHHSSSGLDPVVSFYQRPMTLEGAGNLAFFDEAISSIKMKQNFFLINSGIQRQTAPLVQLFKNKLLDKDYQRKIEVTFVPLSNQLQECWLSGDKFNFESFMKQYSVMQLELFPEYYPESIKRIALHGLKTGDYSVKLCGAGGGGMYLLYKHAPNIAEASLCELPLVEIFT